MSPLLWLAWIALGLTMLFLCSIGVLGAQSMRSPDWDRRFRDEAVAEIRRRGLADRPLTGQQNEAVGRMLGPEHQETSVDPATETRLLDVLAAFTGAADRAETTAELTRRQQETVDAAVARQRAAAKAASTLTWASRRWQLARLWNTTTMTASGMAWILRRGGPHWLSAASRAVGVAAAVSVATGLLWWGLFRSSADADGTGMVATVGNAGAIVGVIGLSFFVVRRVWPTVIVACGPPRSWTRKGAATALIVITIPVAVPLLLTTGVLQGWGEALAAGGAELTQTDVGPRTAGTLFVLSALAFGVYRAVQHARATHLVASHRIGAGVAVLALISMVGLIAAWALDAPDDVAALATGAVGITIMVGAVAVAASATCEWWHKWRELRAVNWPVPRRGFHWWMPVAWLGAIAVASEYEMLHRLLVVHDPAASWPFVILLTALNFILVVAITLSLVPLLIVSWLFTRSVSRSHERFLIDHHDQDQLPVDN